MPAPVDLKSDEFIFVHCSSAFTDGMHNRVIRVIARFVHASSIVHTVVTDEELARLSEVVLARMNEV